MKAGGPIINTTSVNVIPSTMPVEAVEAFGSKVR